MKRKSRFLRMWDDAIEEATLHHSQGTVYEFDDDPEGGPYPVLRVAARTMHAAFMQPKPPKYDPERDK